MRSSIANGGGSSLSAEHSISWSFLDENGVHEVEIFHGTARVCFLFSKIASNLGYCAI